MKKVILFGLSLFAGMAFAQHDPTAVEQCLSHQYIEWQEEQNPGYAAHVEEQFEIAKNSAATKGPEAEYKLPVVVHVVYDPSTPEQNIHDSIIYNQIETLNQDYNRLNPDTVNMRTDFADVAGSPKIEFVLAQVDPNGNPTTGITRTQTSQYTFGDIGLFTGDFSSLEEVKSTADGGIDPWDQSRYINIWVCNMEISGFTLLLGYATPPSNLSNWPAGGVGNLGDGVVVQYQAFGANNPNDLLLGPGNNHEVLGRTLSHEVGHYLGLRHIWGDGDCSSQDGIDDTPNATDQSDGCDTTMNSCVDVINGVDLPDMLENYMDYSDETCQNSFTKGQVALMHGVLENQRYDLAYNNPASVIKEELSASIYPNPTRSTLHVEIDNGQIEKVEVFNTQGQVLLTDEGGNQFVKLNVEGLNNGVYFVKVNNNAGITTVQKFIKH
ncbi:M43 family zinc metalloprotease [Brumimicrobium aurantiacum]|uniref:T9SS C-terminal target domain-containing protein n=1 Tax=Brumimicrobium aurantiacum TaxID=1737063 RepID=A0A3E1F1M6_9FLAO|nr:M43 family zinc metalloprotease [Brumimicrobium aurantiacum]RFC55731.1 T9SS C-terminal target domain-containing protein [Brumimicrobium aurantiacum]